MAIRININADVGESHGRFRLGNDDELLDIVASVNIACGFHGGDASVMRDVCLKAAERGVSIGAHPGFDDLWGFGRRAIEMDPKDLEYMVAYQIGALNALAAYAGARVTHVKAHGALYNMAAVRADYAMAIARATLTVDPTLRLLALAGSRMDLAAGQVGLPVCREAFIDRHYMPDGKLCPRHVENAVIRDPRLAAERAVRMVREQSIIAMDGTVIPTEFNSLCVHGDEEGAVGVAKAVRDALVAEGAQIVAIPQLA